MVWLMLLMRGSMWPVSICEEREGGEAVHAGRPPGPDVPRRSRRWASPLSIAAGAGPPPLHGTPTCGSRSSRLSWCTANRTRPATRRTVALPRSRQPSCDPISASVSSSCCNAAPKSMPTDRPPSARCWITWLCGVSYSEPRRSGRPRASRRDLWSCRPRAWALSVSAVPEKSKVDTLRAARRRGYGG